MLTLACGACADAMIASYLPFVVAWTLLFVGWCLFWGPSASKFARDCGEKPALNPWHYLLAALLVFLATAPLTMGSFLAPMLLVLPIWLLGLLIRRPAVPDQTAEPSVAGLFAHAEARVRRVVLRLSILLVPLSYVFHLVHAWL